MQKLGSGLGSLAPEFSQLPRAKSLMNECRENNVGSLGKYTSFLAAKGLNNEEEPSDLMLRENGALRSLGS